MVKTCLNLGCGKNYLETNGECQWINIDIIGAFKVDLQHDLRKPLPCEDKTVDQIKAKDILEHFMRDEIPEVFRDWIRVLKSGGIIEVIVPNIDAIKGFQGETLLNLIFGEQKFAGVDTSLFGLHKWLFDEDSIKRLFIDNSVEVLECHPVDGTNLYCKGRKI